MAQRRHCIPPPPDPSCYRTGTTLPPPPLASALDDAEHRALVLTHEMEAEDAAIRFKTIQRTVIDAIARAGNGSTVANQNESTIPPRPRAGRARRGLDT